MHQIRFRLGLRLRPRWGSLQCSPDPVPTFKGIRGGKRKGRKEKRRRGGERREGEGKGDGCPLSNSYAVDNLMRPRSKPRLTEGYQKLY